MSKTLDQLEEATRPKHSPTPYSYYNDGKGYDCIDDADDNTVVQRVGKLDGPFIVRACNSHYELLEALEGIVTPMMINGDKTVEVEWRQLHQSEKIIRWQAALNAIKKARGQE